MKINPVFIIFALAGLLVVGFALFGSTVAGARVDEPDENKAEISLQLATMLNYCVAGLALILIGVGFQLASGGGPKRPVALPPPYGAPQPYPQQQALPQQHQAPGQQWGQQAPGHHPPAQG